MTELRWQNPPQTSYRVEGENERVARQLRQRPGEWAVVFQGRKTTAKVSVIRDGRTKAFPAGEFESVAHQVGPRCWDIYARYVGRVES